MSINFHANQYEQAFAAHRLQNWEIPKSAEGRHPRAQTGFSRINANDRGHLLPNIPKDRSSPWGKFVGTWDMPRNIPGNRVLNPTARSEEAWLKNSKAKEDSDVILSGALKKCHTVDPLPVKMETPEDEHSDRPGDCWTGPPASGGQCPPEDTTQCKQRDVDIPGNHECLKWPKAKSPSCRSPDGYAMTPKPIVTMNAANPRTEGGERQHCPVLASEN